MLLLAAVLDRLSQVLAATGVLAIIYVAVVALPLAGDVSSRATAIVNAFAFPGFGTVAFFISRLVRNLASAADTARSRVAELEQQHSRAVVHDLLIYLRLDRFAEADHRTRAMMIAQAQAKHDQMRFYVNGTGGTRDLWEHMNAILRLHPSLRIGPVIPVESDVLLPDDAVEQLSTGIIITAADTQRAMSVSTCSRARRLTRSEQSA